jgi:branched-chain amino acid transport system ATP-binding protein
MRLETPILSIKGATVSYGASPVIRDLSLDVGESEIVALLGPNGAGKTTTLRGVSGLVRLSQGTISFHGRSLAGLSAAQIVRQGISHVPEGRRVFPWLSVLDNLKLGGFHLPRSDLRKQIDAMLQLFPVLSARSKQQAATLSGGEQQMLAIARGLMARPRVLLLDEPSLGLAPIIVQGLFQRLKDILATGVSILLVEQNARLALATASRAYVLERGEIVCSGTSAEVAAAERVFSAYLGGDAARGAKDE